MPSHRLYDLIGVDESATADEIKKAYKRKAVQCHPDKGGDQEEFKELTRAYEVLSDEQQRQRYNAVGDEGLAVQDNGNGGGNFHAHFEDLFANVFGGAFAFNRGQPPQPQGTTFMHNIEIELKDAFTGLQRTMSVRMQKNCTACLKTCSACNGQGHCMRIIQLAPGFQQSMMTQCTQCEGKGKRNFPGCGVCHSRGSIDEAKDIELIIPRGCDDGHEIRFPGFGRTPNDVLIIKVRVKQHETFERSGNDLVYKKIIMLTDAILGTDIHIPHFTGDMVVDTRPWGVLNPARKYMVPGSGMVNASGAAGNLILSFEICYPTNPLTNEKRDALRPLLAALT